MAKSRKKKSKSRTIYFYYGLSSLFIIAGFFWLLSDISHNVFAVSNELNNKDFTMNSIEDLVSQKNVLSVESESIKMPIFSTALFMAGCFGFLYTSKKYIW